MERSHLHGWNGKVNPYKKLRPRYERPGSQEEEPGPLSPNGEPLGVTQSDFPTTLSRWPCYTVPLAFPFFIVSLMTELSNTQLYLVGSSCLSFALPLRL